MSTRRVLPPTMPAPASGMDWRHRSACRDEDPELFFPIGTVGPAAAQIEEAKSVCRSCPVREECLTWSLETRQAFGVWGGLSEQEREAMIRRPRATRPTYTACDECLGPLGENRVKYCSDECCNAAKKRRDAARSHHRDGAA